MVIKINAQGLVWKLNVSWIWWFYETFWDLVEREKPTLPFFSNLEVLKCQSNSVAAQTFWWLLPFLDLLQFLLLVQGCFFQPTKSTDNAHCLLSIKKKIVCCWRKVRDKFRERYHCSASYAPVQGLFQAAGEERKRFRLYWGWFQWLWLRRTG